LGARKQGVCLLQHSLGFATHADVDFEFASALAADEFEEMFGRVSHRASFL
jgi:hypothetical protein